MIGSLRASASSRRAHHAPPSSTPHAHQPWAHLPNMGAWQVALPPGDAVEASARVEMTAVDSWDFVATTALQEKLVAWALVGTIRCQ